MKLYNDPNLVGYWPLDGNSLEYANRYYPTRRKTCTNIIASSSQQWSIATGTGLNPSGTSASFTITTWIKMNAYNSAYHLIAGKGDYVNAGDDRGYWFYIDGVNSTQMYIGCYFMNNGATVPQQSINADALLWHHVAVTYSASNDRARFFIDGVQTGGDYTVTTNISASTAAFSMGNASGMTGSVKQKDTRFYNVELTPAQVADTFTNPLGSPISGCQGWWPFQNDGNDYSGNGNHLTNSSCTFVDETNDMSATGTPTPVLSKNRFIPNSLAYRFNGTTDYLATSTTPFYFPRTQPMSAIYWFRDLAPAATLFLCSIENSSFARQFLHYLDTTGNCVLDISPTNSGANQLSLTSSGGTLNDGKNHCLIITYDGSSTTAGIFQYQDGRIMGRGATTQTLSSSMTNDGTPLRLAIRNPNAGGYSNIELHEVALFSRVLSPKEISDYYQWMTGTKIKKGFWASILQSIIGPFPTFFNS